MRSNYTRNSATQRINYIAEGRKNVLSNLRECIHIAHNYNQPQATSPTQNIPQNNKSEQKCFT